MNSKRWITLLLVFCLVLSGIAPAANAVRISATDSITGGTSNWFQDLMVSAGEALGLPTLKKDQSHLLDNDYSLSLKNGQWIATTSDGKDIVLTDAQLPAHIQVLRKAAGDFQPADQVTAFVVLKDAPTADTYSNILEVPSDVKASLLAKQTELISAIEQAVGGVQVIRQYTHLTNALVITTAFGNLEQIAAVSGVKNVFLNPEFQAMTTKEEQLKPFTISSSNMSGVAQVWQDLGYTGQGMTVAILDTGLDVDHPSFADAPAGASWDVEKLQQMLDSQDLNLEALHRGEITAEDLYYNEKIPFTFNYATGLVNVTHNDSLGDHGTHVAGITAANNVEGTNVSGMAPDAQIFAMKVFSPSGGAGMYTIIDALEDCMKLGVDVVNMSLGSAAGFSYSGNEEVDSIFARISQSDIIVDVAVGNEGSSNAGSNWGYNKMPTTHIDNGTVASPATYANSMGVASADNKVIAADYFELADGTEIFYQYSIEFLYGYISVTIANLHGMGNLEYVVIDGLGHEEDFYDENGNSLVEGKVALIKRGEIEFGRKAVNAQNAGAVAAIIWNTDDSDVFYFGMTTETTDGNGNQIYPDIPVGLITLSDGQKMADAETKTLIVNGDYSFREDVLGGQISSFSCWGTSGDLRLLPDITGVGGNVYSTLDGGAYGLMSGTSMACPQVAGVTTLVMQYIKETFPNATEAETRVLCDSLIMSTAEVIIDRDTGLETSPRQQGAGLVNALGAITAEAYLTVAGSARPKVELGDNENGEFTFTFTVHNYSDAAKTYTLRSSLLCEDYQLSDNFPGVYFLAEEDRALDNKAVTFSRDTVTVAAGGSEEITVTIKLTDADKEWIHTYFPSGNYVEGYVYLEGEEEVTLSLPFMGFYENWDDAPLFDSGFWYDPGMWGVPGAAHTANQFYHLLWISLGGASNDWMLGLNPYRSTTITDENGQVIGVPPYNTYNNVLSPNGDGAADMISELYLSLMRNAAKMEITYTDEAGEVLHYELLEKDSKTMFISGYGSVVPMVYSWYYDDLYDFSDLEDGDVVYLTITGNIDYEDARTDVLFDKMPIYIDLSAPVMDTNSVQESTVDGRNYLTFTFQDAHPAAAVLMNKSGSQIYQHYGEEDMIQNADGSWTVTMDVTGLGEKITVALCDYGCNEAYYDLTYTLTDNTPNMDKTALYAYQVFHDYIFYSQGWDYMFGWATLSKDEASAKMLQSDAYEYYALNAAEYVDDLIFAVDAGHNFLYMEPGVWNRNVICNIGYNVVDMAWDSVTEQMYLLVSDKNAQMHGLFTIDLLTGELTQLKNYYYATEMPWAMTFVDGQLYCCKQEAAGFFTVDFEDDYAVVPVTLADGTPFVPQASNGEDVEPMYAQSMTYSAADGKIYWAYYGQSCQSMIVIDPTTWEHTADSFTYDQEYVGLLTMEENSYDLPASDAVTRIIMSHNKVVMSAGRTQQLGVTLLPWNAPVTENVIWTTEDPSVATVDQNGLVTAVGGGTAIITATYGDLEVQCEIQVVDIDGNMFAYKYYDGQGRSYYWVNVDLETITEEGTVGTEFDFLAADYNGHDGKVYGFSDDGQCYRFDPITGEYEALGQGDPNMLPSDMAYDYSTGLMYAIIYNEQTWSTTLYTVNMSSGKLTPVATADDIFVTLACSTEGQLYGINTTGILFELHVMDAGDTGLMPLDADTGKVLFANYVMQTPADSVYYAQSMCYDHNNDVLLWCNTDYGTLFCLAGLQSAEPYAVELGDPSGTGMIQYIGAYVVPEEITELPFNAVTSVEVEDMILMSGDSKQPVITVNPANATYASIVSVYTDDESVAYYDAQTGKVVAVGAGSTKLHIEIVDAGFDGIIDDLDYRYTAEATVSVKAGTDNIYGYLMADLATMGGFYWISIDDENPKNYAGESAAIYQGMNLTLYSAEYVDGMIYAYGYDSDNWEANFLFLTIDPKSWSVQSAIDMGDGFPFVYDMAYDYTTGTMYALAGAGSNNTDLYYVNMANGKLVECMITDPMFMSLAIDKDGTIYAMASSETSELDPETGAGTAGNAMLYTLDVKNGTWELFMDTGFKSNMLASMAYDYDTGYIYWTGLLSAGKYESGLYLIDPADKSCNNLGTIGRVGAQVTCLMIIADEYPEIPTNLSNLALTTTMAEVAVGGTYALDLFVTPESADATFTWTSANKNVATVDENGVVTGVSAGTTTVTVTATDGTNTFTASCTVVVYGLGDYFLTYNHTLGGFAKISRPDSSIVTQFTEAEDASPVTAMDFIDGVLYAYDEEGNLFTTTEESGFVRDYIGHCGITVEDPYEKHTSYVDGDSKYGYDYYYTPNFRVRDMAYDAANNRLLVLGAQTLHCIIEYWFESPTYNDRYVYADETYELEGGCKVYEVDLETGELTEVCTVGGKEFPMHGVTMLTVTDSGDVYTYSFYLDYIMKLDLETGLFEDLATFQNIGVKGSDENDLMAMTYDASTDALVMLFTTNGNAHSMYKFSLKNQTISFIGFVGDVTLSYGYAYGDYFGGLALNIPAAMLGDVNGDGLVDTTDAKLIMQYDLGLIDASALNLSVADVNGDGLVDTTDAKLIMQLDLGLIDAFPAGN